MKKLDFKQDFLAIKRIIEKIKTTNSPSVIWQNVDGKRILKLVFIEGNLFDHQIIWLRADEGNKLTGLISGPAYLYCSAKQVVAKVKIKEIQSDILSLYYPKEIFLTTSDKDDLIDHYEQLSASEMFQSQPKKDAISNLENLHFNEPSTEGSYDDLSLIWGTNWKDFGTVVKSIKDGPVECPLLDYSSGGASILFHNPSYFQKGDKITIAAKNKGNKILNGEIVSIQVFNDKDYTFKIGIRF